MGSGHPHPFNGKPVTPVTLLIYRHLRLNKDEHVTPLDENLFMKSIKLWVTPLPFTEYLKDLFTRLPAAKITQIKDFTPVAWAKAKDREKVVAHPA
jgi:hypothetical protein